MTVFTHNSEPIKAYRAAAAELHEYSFAVEKKFQEAGEIGNLIDAREALSELRLRTKAFEELRARLTPLNLFIAKYGVEALDDRSVAFVLPKGVSRIALLLEANELSAELHEANPENYRAMRAVGTYSIKRWGSQCGFTRAPKEAISLGIDGNVEDSNNLDIDEQRHRGWNNVELQDLAVAHTVFYLLTGKSLFQEKIVRADGGALSFSPDGLHDRSNYTAHRSYYVSASRYLLIPN